MTGGPEQSAGEERGDARLRAGGVRWQVGPERALRGTRPVWADRVREGEPAGPACWARAGEGKGRLGRGERVLGRLGRERRKKWAVGKEWAGLFWVWVLFPFLFLFLLQTHTNYFEFKLPSTQPK